MMTPVLLFTYKKLAPLKRAVKALQENTGAQETELYIFSDAAKTNADVAAIEEVRDFLDTVQGFKKVTVYKSSVNKGLAASIIGGVNEIFKTYTRAIILEDDLISSTNFLEFMNQGLDYYQDNDKVISICGYTVPVAPTQDYTYDNYFTRRSSSWGWATWKDRWEYIDWDVSDYNSFKKDKVAQKRFNAMGSDMTSMLAQQMDGKLNSWAIRFCYHQFKNDLLSVFPTVSKISNEGFGADATHTKEKFNRYATPLDGTNKSSFDFNPQVKLLPHFTKQFYKVYSLTTRIKYKLLNTLFK